MEANNMDEVFLGGLKASDGEREEKKKLKRQARNHRYYLKHQGELQERARTAYYRLREKESISSEATTSDLKESTEGIKISQESKSKDGTSDVLVPALLALVGTGVAFIALTAKQNKGQEQPQQSAPSANQNSWPLDMGGGQIIQIKRS